MLNTNWYELSVTCLLEYGVDLASAYATAASICRHATSIRIVVEYGLRKRFSFSSKSALDMTAYVAKRWVSRSSVLDPLYPQCDFWRTRRNVSSTVPRSCWRRSRSTFKKVLKASVAASFAYQMDAATGTVVLAGMTVVAPGFRGEVTLVFEGVA